MAFQFICPQGHLLEGDPSQAGQQCQCPQCGTVFVIPAAAAPATAPPGGQGDVDPMQPAFPDVTGQGAFPDVAGQSAFPDLAGQGAAPDATGQGVFPDVGAPGATSGAFDPTGLSGPQMVHIPCPQGHLLETPPEMIGEDVMCPHCGEMFRLREQDSIEYQRKKKQEEELADYRSGRKWFTWAVVIAVVVVVSLILMIALGTWE